MMGGVNPSCETALLSHGPGDFRLPLLCTNELACARKWRVAMVATASDEKQMVRAVVTLEMAGHPRNLTWRDKKNV
jgi:hypothetical protein